MTTLANLEPGTNVRFRRTFTYGTLHFNAGTVLGSVPGAPEVVRVFVPTEGKAGVVVPIWGGLCIRG